MQDTLLDFAKVDIMAVKAMKQILTGDTLEINIMGYHAQQALEKCFKHQLEMRGVKYPYVHDLSELLDSSQELKTEVPVDLRLELATISRWESKSGYIKGYRVAQVEFDRVYPMILEYIQNVISSEREVQQTNEFN